MTITYQPVKELDDIRVEIQRLKAREKSLRAVLLSRPFRQGESGDADTVERQLRQVFRQPRFFQRTGT
ncbi:hypothetical protein [Sedimentitalea todarodis]|uniref:Uncharacterized protein n=1 Tax=Sedimentitalea todarodis TaxID=1631240 RepID=A0ABU3VHG2_9RHOB|nr:hypothetical protein [Sedimentitalea todarodis]MDU9005114.1 hypothetical protein [Sedimentitalea todarodis]